MQNSFIMIRLAVCKRNIVLISKTLKPVLQSIKNYGIIYYNYSLKLLIKILEQSPRSIQERATVTVLFNLEIYYKDTFEHVYLRKMILVIIY